MIRIIATSVLVLLSATVIIVSFELKSWNINMASNDAQSFIKAEATQLDKSSWEKYIGRKLNLNLVTSNIFQIDLMNVSAAELPSLLDKFAGLRYARLHKLNIIASQPDQMFTVSAVMTLN